MFILVLHSLMFVYLAKSVTIVSHGQIADDETRWLLVLEALHSRNDSQYDWCRPHAVIIAWGTTSNLYIDPAAQLVVSCGDRHCYLARNYWDSNSRQKIDNEYAMCTLSAPRWKPVIFDTRRLLLPAETSLLLQLTMSNQIFGSWYDAIAVPPRCSAIYKPRRVVQFHEILESLSNIHHTMVETKKNKVK